MIGGYVNMSGNVEILLKEKLGERFDDEIERVLNDYAHMIDRKAALYILGIENDVIKRRKKTIVSFSEPIEENSSVSFAGRVERVFVPFESKMHHTMRILLGDSEGNNMVLVLWDSNVDAMLKQGIEAGDRLNVKNVYYKNGEAHAGNYSSISIEKKDRISYLSRITDGRCNVAVRLAGGLNVRTYVRNGEEKQMASGWAADVTGRVRLLVWNEAVSKISGAELGDVLRIFGAVFRNGELHVNEYSKVEINPADCIVLSRVDDINENMRTAYSAKLISSFEEGGSLCCATRGDGRDIKAVLHDDAKKRLIGRQLSPDIDLNTPAFFRLKSLNGRECIFEGKLNANGIFECSRIHID